MITLRNCEHCGNEFEAKRRDASFCSNNCRAHFHNNKVQTASNQFQQPRQQQPIRPIAQPIYGLSGAGFEDPRIGRLQEKIEDLKDEKQKLNIEIIQLKANQQIKEKIDEFRLDENATQADQSGGGLMGIVDKVTENDRLMELLGNVFAAKFGGNGGSDSENVFDGVDDVKKNNLQALVQIAKTLPDSVVEMLLSVAGKAAQNPDGFMEGINKLENQTKAPFTFVL